MNKYIKIGLIISGIILALILTAQWWMELRFEHIINTNPERKYNIVYDDIDFSGAFTEISLSNARLVPMDSTGDATETQVHARMQYVDISGVSWLQMLFTKNFNIDKITFVEPDFTIWLGQDSTSSHQRAGQSFQDIFRDVLNRASLNEFFLIDGKVEVVSVKNRDTTRVASVGNLTIQARGLMTDSVQLRHLIPFKLESLESIAREVTVQLSAHSFLTAGNIAYNNSDASLVIHDVSMKFNADWREVVREMGEQVDMIEFDLAALSISELDAASSFYGNPNIQARKILIDSLHLTDARNKNFPRPPDSEKPMFKSLLDKIPLNLGVDTIAISNCYVSYSEIPEGKSEMGTIEFTDVNGSINNVSTDSIKQQMLEFFNADLTAKINHQAPLLFRLRVPYSGDQFDLNVNVTSMDATILNQTLIPLTSVEIESGNIQNMNLFMEAYGTYARNEMKFIYNDLRINVLQDNQQDKSGLLSALANAVIHQHNETSDNHYTEPGFTSTRNIYRGPFNLMWVSIKDGLVRIVPTNAGSRILQKKQEKNE